MKIDVDRIHQKRLWPTPSLQLVSCAVNGFYCLQPYSPSLCVWVTAFTLKIFASDQMMTWSTARCISSNVILPLSYRFCLEAAESNCLDCSLYAVSIKSFLNISFIDDLEMLSWLTLFLVLLRKFCFTHFITFCTIGSVRIKLSRSGIGLLGVVADSVYRFHKLNTVLRHTSNCFVMLRLLFPAVFRGKF